MDKKTQKFTVTFYIAAKDLEEVNMLVKNVIDLETWQAGIKIDSYNVVHEGR